MLSTLAIYGRFHDSFFKTGDQKLIEAWGDGLKTYTNAIYHIRHDSTYTFFEGMNYPYREHIMAATELPGVTIFLKFVNEHIVEISDAFVINFIHWLLMTSLILCSLFIFLIFKELRVAWWFAIPIAIGLTFLSPQMFRLKGHFGLAVAFVIPMIYYLLLKFEQKKHWKWSVWMAAAVLFSAQFHFYFFAIVAAIILIYLTSGYAFATLRSVNPSYLKTAIKYAGHFAIMVGIPFLFFLFWMILNDPVSDRSPKPFGFLYYMANWEGVFLMKEMPFYQWISNHITEIRKTPFEGRVYVGMVATAFCLVMLLRWILGRFKKGLFDFYYPQQTYLYSLFYTGFILVVFACGFPFAIPGMDFLLDYFGPIQQFRSIGRFAWAFYFAINIIAFTSLYQYLSQWKNNYLKIVSFLLLITILSYEGWQSSHLRTYQLTRVPYLENGKEFTSIDSIDFSKYQAIVPIPYFNIGSNNLEKGAQGFSTQRSFVMGAQTGLPISASMMTRTSKNQTYKQFQLVTQPYRMPEIFEDFRNKNPLLLIWWKKLNQSETKQFAHLKEGAKLIFEDPSMELYEMSLSVFEKRILQRRAAIEAALSRDKLFNHAGFLSSDSLLNFVYQNFDSNKSDSPYFGRGGFQGISTQNNILYEGQIPNLDISKPHSISFWANIQTDRYGIALQVILEEFDGDGKTLQRKVWALGREIAVMNTKHWILSEKQFKAKAADSHFRLTVKWNNRESTPLFLDELLIKPVNTELFKNGKDFFWRNNRHY